MKNKWFQLSSILSAGPLTHRQSFQSIDNSFNYRNQKLETANGFHYKPQRAIYYSKSHKILTKPKKISVSLFPTKIISPDFIFFINQMENDLCFTNSKNMYLRTNIWEISSSGCWFEPPAITLARMRWPGRIPKPKK